MGPDVSQLEDRIIDALADNLHRLLIYDFHGLSADDSGAAAIKTIRIAIAQVGADPVNASLERLHPELRERVSALRGQSPEAFA